MTNIKLLSMIISIFLTLMNSTLTPEQYIALYQCHFWDGTTITTSNSVVEVRNNHLCLNEKDYGEIQSIDPYVEKEDITEWLADYSDPWGTGHWEVNYTRKCIELIMDDTGNGNTYFIHTEGEWSVKVADGLIMVYDEKGKKIMQIDIITTLSKVF